MRRRVVLISGWAHRRESLGELGGFLGRLHEVKLFSADEFLGDGEELRTEALKEAVSASDLSCVVVGWSMGALVALEATSRWPNLIDGVVALAGTASFVVREDYAVGVPVGTIRAMTRELRKSPENVLDRFFGEVAAPRESSSDERETSVRAALSFPVDRLVRGLDYLAVTDLRERLCSLRTPCLVVNGAQDRIVPWRAGRYLADSLPRGRFSLEGYAGHAFPLQEPELTAEKISNFLEYAVPEKKAPLRCPAGGGYVSGNKWWASTAGG